MNIFAILLLIFIVSKVLEKSKKTAKPGSPQMTEMTGEGKPLDQGKSLGEGMPLETRLPLEREIISPFPAPPAESKQFTVAVSPSFPVKNEKAKELPLVQMAKEKELPSAGKEFVHSFSSRPQTVAMAAENLAKHQERLRSSQEEAADDIHEQTRQELVRGVIMSEILTRPRSTRRFPKR